MPTAQGNGAQSKGAMGEVLWQADDGSQALLAFVSWVTTSDTEIPAYHWFQNYVQWENESEPGMYESVTCNAGYVPTDAFAE